MKRAFKVNKKHFTEFQNCSFLNLKAKQPKYIGHNL